MDIPTCKFCHRTNQMKADDGQWIDIYICDECESYVCYECLYTSPKTGNDYCMYCKRNLQIEGKLR